AGDSFQVPVQLSRSAKLLTDVEVSVVPPPEIADLVVAQPLKIPADEDRGTIKVSVKSDPRLTGRWTLLLKATTLQDGKWPVVSQTKVDVEFSNSRR
ncbi:MAG: hypothetical protein MI861_16840, partial [Pirellulales bacterium]|nr:hypothetical protein [Pirellulales bacterium]